MLDGVRVIEVGMWLAGPVAGGLLADWGADVVKIEPVHGDPMRRLYGTLSGSNEKRCPPFDTFNRGKRSVAIDLGADGAASAMDTVISSADVFVTNLRPTFLARVGLGADDLTRRHPRLVYASLTGYGSAGPDKDAPGFDVAAFTARSGIGERMQRQDADPPPLPGGMGDVITGMTMVGGIVGALFARERTGRGQIVTSSLLRTGIFSIGMDVSALLGLGRVANVKDRSHVPNPLMNTYRAGDGKWFWLIGAESDRHWPALRGCLGADELSDERFATPRDRRRNAPDLVAALDTIFATHSRAEWADRFEHAEVWWTPVNAVADLPEDPQVIASGALGTPGKPLLASPIEFADHPLDPDTAGPPVGSDTVAILTECGVAADEIDSLRASGAIAGAT